MIIAGEGSVPILAGRIICRFEIVILADQSCLRQSKDIHAYTFFRRTKTEIGSRWN